MTEHPEQRLRDALAAWLDADEGGTDQASRAALVVLAEAEAMRAAAPLSAADHTWHQFLDLTGRPSFLTRLPDRAARDRWADVAIDAIRHSRYTLADMLAQRVARHPERVLFEDPREAESSVWTYAQVSRYTRTLAAVFLGEGAAEPRVAIYAENSIDSACSDLACLLHGILVSPINVHTDVETLVWMCDRLAIDIVITDSDERLDRLALVRDKVVRPFRVYRTGSRPVQSRSDGLDAVALRHACAQIDLTAAAARTRTRTVRMHEAATVMFTSGSTGRPKGVVFSHFSLVAKRVARGAALPAVGADEVLLCYLPLFHTFGRFLEMLGSVYWGATYVFAGSPSAESLMAELARVRPTGLVSIPVRWAQIREQAIEIAERDSGTTSETTALRQIVGERLRWGLSAAGFLDPAVFRFFQRHGVDLCSGFGMTEATGGITMTPPGAYVDGTVGLPLPGVRVRLSEQGELQMAGPYVVRYLEEDGPPGSLPTIDPDADHWIATGDVFVRHDSGYLEIVDRIKDIYKNSRGQTVAPQRVEQRLASVPGVRRTFLAGDHRDHNVLLIVPDRDDPVLAGRTDDQAHEYFAQIVTSVNAGLAPYERVVRFAVLDRDFDVAQDELTPKGSFRRKVIEQHFSAVIEDLYRSTHVDIRLDGLSVRIPRWFVRDLAILEDDVVAAPGGVLNRRNGERLRVAKESDGRARIGDLVYALPGDTVDLGLFARQPLLWLGNPALAAFAPCKPGWDVALRGVSAHVRLAVRARTLRTDRTGVGALRLSDDDGRLREVHEWCARALFGRETEAAEAAERLAGVLGRVDPRLGSAIRRRLEAVAYRPEAALRAQAYRILLLDEPSLGDDRVFPAFVESGRSFLDEPNVAIIAAARHGERRLQALRQRLASYRSSLTWPGSPARRAQFASVFRLLADFARHHREDFPAVQAELACWALFRDDPAIARLAARQLDGLSRWYEGALTGRVRRPDPGDLDARLVFESGIPRDQREMVREVLADPTFLARSTEHACADDGFSWERVGPGGIWVSPVLSHAPTHLFRLGVNLTDGRHFDLLLVLGKALRRREVRDTVLWLTALSCHGPGPSAMPRFGAWRQDLGAISVAYVSDLTAWERIRELASQHDVRDGIARTWAWKKLFVRSMAAYFRGWEQSGFRIVPGAVAPANVALPDADFQEHASILSLAGWRPYDGPLAIVSRLVRGFYRLTWAHYPQSRDVLQLGWIFDACFEGVGDVRAARFLLELDEALAQAPVSPDLAGVRDALAGHLAGLRNRLHVPLPVLCAVERFRDWERSNPGASVEAREEAVVQMIHLYRLDRFPDAFRYFVYQRAYFVRADAEVRRILDTVVARRLRADGGRHDGLEELSELQARLTDPADREVFSRMVFPQAQRTQRIELAAAAAGHAVRVVVQSTLVDESGGAYIVREPAGPAEVGQLYRLILDTGYPKHIGEADRQLVVVDGQERVVGGLCYRWRETGVVYIDGIVVTRQLTNQGIGGRLVEDFCVRMAADGARCVTTNYFLGRLFSKHGFQVNQRWGGLVRMLREAASED